MQKKTVFANRPALFVAKTQWIQLMRISVCCSTFLMLAMQLLLANHSKAQRIEDVQIRFGIDNQSLKSALQQLQERSGFNIFYLSPKADGYDHISLPEGQRSVAATLELLLQHTSLQYHQVEHSIVLSERVKGVREDENDVSSEVQQRVVEGTVISASDGKPLEGATVKLKQGGVGVMTGKDGIFHLTTPIYKGVLVVTFVGYQTQEVDFNPDTQIPMTIKLAGEGNELEEAVVNAGYYETTKRLSTGNISKVDAVTIGKQPVTNVLSALIGRMSGVQINQNSGLAGGDYSIQIRGRNSLRTEGNDPLYLLNGVPFPSTSFNQLTGGVIPQSNPLNVLSPTDILSIEVLKDADATAIYGSRGANGVVLITTKKGRMGEASISMQAQTGITHLAKKMELLNTAQYLEMRQEAFANDKAAPTLANAPDLLLWDTTRYTDWQKVLLGGTGHHSTLNASLSGAANEIQYLLSGTYGSETTVFPGNYTFKRGAVNSSLNYTSKNRKMTLQSSLMYGASSNTLPTENLVSLALQLPPDAPEPYIGGQLNWAKGTWTNPFKYMEQSSVTNSNNMNASLTVQYRLLSNLSIKALVSFNKIMFKETQLNPVSALDPAGADALISSSLFADNTETGYNLEPQIEYKNKLVGGAVQVLLGTTFQENNRQGRTLAASGFSSDALMEQLGNAEELRGNSSFTQYRYNALFGRINYNSSDRYLLNITFRRDGSSRFGPGKQWGNFGAAGAAWIFSDEKFLKKQSTWLSMGKLRLSYGLTGSDQIGDYAYLDTYQSSGVYLIPGLAPSRLANEQFGWEVNKKLEIALETGFLNNRIQMDMSYFRNRSSNQLIGYQLPDLTGFPSVQANYPATIQNTGYEFELTARVMSNGHFSWKANANFTLPYNRLLAFPDIEKSSYSNLVVGKPRPQTFAYVFSAVDPETGTFQFQDLNGDGAISATDDRILLSRPPAYFGGVGNSFTMGHFDTDIFLQFARQDDFDYRSSFSMPGMQQNQPVEVLERWKQTGDGTPVAKFSQASATLYNRWASSDINFNGHKSYVRLRNVALSYHVPAGRLQRLKMKDVRVNLEAQNLYTFTKYKGLDPESLTLPPLRTFVIGLNITL
ncbi:TonB-linked outer membrane protein, SusC/RagA family [bacterium A37T11]|nr:TonB-linked outer membrane protein, SusC/RagA family [bacterium A37T11]